ncbi:MAG: glutamate-1-semialdehyde-2,1-aminomutase [Planctomycetes bacterium GWF2_42_9]|nr:MAG: glutamate-1-semialdehyde-2,1-aminomutase [Planctomycetes bacterium GWF2_42_9]HAL44749.1 glutamate-1-semialdehyde-2,1-aminomutase [Phycisphaerales bacterium]
MNSQKAFKKAQRFIPGGVNSPVRAFGSVKMSPIFIAKGNGSKIYDINGNEYIDYVCSWGPLILGHAHPKITSAVISAAKKGTSFGAPTVAETELAEIICGTFDSIDKVRLVSSGTEAVMTAVRLARAFTGRKYILKIAGCYHGHSDSMLVSAGSGSALYSKPLCPGVPDELSKLTVIADYNNIDSAAKSFEKYKGKIAACIIEPVAANMGVVLPKNGYLANLRKLCSQNKSLLIFDEVITGFRLCFGGAQTIFKIQPDITCLGKIVGGGLPCAAVGGRKEIMDMLAPCGNVYQAGTLSGNPLATAAATATLKILKNEKIYAKLEENAKMLEAGLLLAAKNNNIPMIINRIGSLMSCFFTKLSVENFSDAKSADANLFKAFFAGMLKNGIYLAPSPLEAMFISAAHSKKDIAKTLFAAQNVLTRL